MYETNQSKPDRIMRNFTIDKNPDATDTYDKPSSKQTLPIKTDVILFLNKKLKTRKMSFRIIIKDNYRMEIYT